MDVIEWSRRGEAEHRIDFWEQCVER